MKNETGRITLDLTPETIAYLDYCKARGGFASRSQVIEAVLPDALEDWEECKDAETDALEADPTTATWTTRPVKAVA